jgi:hypothetical protein
MQAPAAIAILGQAGACCLTHRCALRSSVAVTEELEVLRIVSERLESAGVSFMLTGSFALGYYAKPRMTRDLDLVVAMQDEDVGRVVRAFAADFYVDEDAVRAAVRSQRIFNLMHLDSGIKVDLIVRQDTDYRQVEFARRQATTLAGVRTWITSREDLILSKLEWARESGSELQMRDVRTLIDEGLDWAYLRQWAARLGVDVLLDQAGE